MTNSVRQKSLLSRRLGLVVRGLSLAATLAAGALPKSTWGAEAPKPVVEAAKQSQDKESTEKQPEAFPLDLGAFHVRDWRPTRNETPNLRFSVVVVFSPETSAKTREQLVHWKNRLRDQAIIAMRLAETKEFTEPGLEQIQRLVRVRIKRAMPMVKIDAVLLTDFALGDD